MAKELFVPRDFREKSMKLIRHANRIIDEWRAQGFTLTLRQLYYQFVSDGIIPNKLSEYKRLGSVLNDARLAGKIDWLALEDRTRELNTIPAWRSPQEIVQACAEQYQADLWADQDTRVEVWIEKDALIGVIEPACKRWRVPYFACRGNTSASEMYTAAKRFEKYARQGYRTILLHLGDHDPSGLDMTRDNDDRLNLLARGRGPEVRRIALNMDQVDEYALAPNPAKETDSRYDAYVERYGTYSSWELDALRPNIIDGLIEENVSALVDMDLWQKAVEREEAHKATLANICDRWEDVEDRYGPGDEPEDEA